MVDHAKPRHGCGNAAFGCLQRPFPRLDRIGGNHLALDEHPAQHVLRLRITLFGGKAVKPRSFRVIGFDALALEKQ